MPPKAPRSGARRLARGTRFLRTPGIETHQESHPGRGARSPRHPFRVRIPELSKIFQGYAKNAYPWLIPSTAPRCVGGLSPPAIRHSIGRKEWLEPPPKVETARQALGDAALDAELYGWS